MSDNSNDVHFQALDSFAALILQMDPPVMTRCCLQRNFMPCNECYCYFYRICSATELENIWYE